MTDTTIAAETINLADFWLQLEISLDLAAVDDDCTGLVHQMIDRYFEHRNVLDPDAASDGERRTMLRQALAICARH
jgi:hypothetical protein